MFRTKKIVYVMLVAIFILPFTSFPSSFPTYADNGTYEDVQNEDQISYNGATLNKQVSIGDEPGEFIIDLTVEGSEITREREKELTADIVLVYDNSNSMDERMRAPDGSNSTRAQVAKQVTSDFVQSILSNDNINIALLTYGGAVFDGSYYSWLNNYTENYSYKTLTNNPSNIISNIPSNVPSDRGYTDNGGTFTQHGLRQANQILQNSTADKQFIITITDGEPTYAFTNNSSNSVIGDGTSTSQAMVTNTISQADALKNTYDGLYSIGIGITGQYANQVIYGLASSSNNAFVVGEDDVEQLQNSLNAILVDIEESVHPTIEDGFITDPMGDMFTLKGSQLDLASDHSLTDGNYYISASDSSILNDLTSSYNNETLTLSHLNLGKNESIHLTYKIQVQTENSNFETDTFYHTNGLTTLTPKPEDDTSLKFPEPKAKVSGLSIPVEKIWKGDKLDDITVFLLQNNNAFKEEILSEATDWKHTFSQLIPYDNNGQFYNYTIEEEDLEDYLTEIEGNQDDGYTITNRQVIGPTPLEPALLSFDVEKVWQGDPLDEVTVQLLADGTVVDEATLSESTNWKHTFEDFPNVNDITDKEPIDYQVLEKDVNGYISVVEGNVEDGFEIINTRSEKIDISVEKHWNGEMAKEVTIELYANDELTDTAVLSNENDWNHTFEEKDAFDENGQPIEYSISEIELDGYKSSISGNQDDGFSITNTRVGKRDLTVEKIWKGEASDSVTVELYANGELADSTSLSNENDWMHTFNDLDEFDNDGQLIHYTIKELKIDGYETKVSGNQDDGFTVTNTRIGERDIAVEKIWKGEALDSVTIELYANGELIDTAELSDENNWQHIFANLDEFDSDGLPIEYMVYEQPLDDYSTSIDGNEDDGFTVTNTRIGERDIAVEKVWKGETLDSVTVDLYANGELADTAELSDENNWQHIFANLDEFDSDGLPIEYTIIEIEIEDYASEITGDQDKGFTVTNTRTGKTEIDVEKVWELFEKEAETVTVNLLANGENADSVELSDDNDWTHTFANLDAFDSEGEPIEYTVEEVEVEGFETDISGDADNGFTITNKEIVNLYPLDPVTKVDVKKVWEGKALEKVKIILYSDDKKVDSVILSEGNNWKHTFNSLPKYSDETHEHLIEYTIEEMEVEGYEVTIEGNQDEGFVVTNKEIIKRPKTPDKPDEITIDEGDPLPKTATNTYNYILIGALFTLVSIFLLLFSYRRES